MNQKTPTIWTSKKRRELFEKEQKFGISKEVQELTKKHQQQAAAVEKFLRGY